MTTAPAEDAAIAAWCNELMDSCFVEEEEDTTPTATGPPRAMHIACAEEDVEHKAAVALVELAFDSDNFHRMSVCGQVDPVDLASEAHKYGSALHHRMVVNSLTFRRLEGKGRCTIGLHGDYDVEDVADRLTVGGQWVLVGFGLHMPGNHADADARVSIFHEGSVPGGFVVRVGRAAPPEADGKCRGVLHIHLL